MTNDVRIVVTSDNQVAKGFAASLASVKAFTEAVDRAGSEGAEAVDRIAASVQRAGGDFRTLTGEVKTAGSTARQAGQEGAKGVRGMRDEVQDTTRSTLDLTAALKRAQAEYDDMVKRAAAAGGGDNDSNNAVKSARASLNALKSLSKEAEEVGKRAGQTFVSGTHQAIEGGIGALPPGAKAAVVGAIAQLAVASAPVLGSAISAAVLSGIGGGALAAGVAAAVTDPAVSASFTLLGNQAQAQFKAAGASFRQPLIDAAKSFADTLKGLDLGGVLAPMAAEIKPLSDGLSGLVRNALPGIKSAVAAAAPLIDTIANELPDIGEAIGSFAQSMGEASDGAKRLTSDVLNFAEHAIVSIGKVISWLSQWYEFSRDVSDKLGDIHPFVGWVEDLLGMNRELEGTLTPLNNATDASGAYAMTQEQAAAAAKTAADAFNQERDAADSLSQTFRTQFDSSIALEQAIDDMTKSVQDHGKTLDITSQSGRDNVRVVESGIDAALRAAKAEQDRAVAEGDLAGATTRSNAVRDAAIDKLRRHAAELGLNKAAVDRLIDSILALPTGERSLEYKIHVATYGDGSGNLTAAQQNNINRLIAKSTFSEGGPVEGGSGIRDDVNAALMGGEHVLTKAEVSAMGGQDAVTRWRKSLMGGGQGAPMAAGTGSDKFTLGRGPSGAATYTIGSDGSAVGDALVALIASTVRSQGGDPGALGIKVKD
jgi:hypothetical protein